MNRLLSASLLATLMASASPVLAQDVKPAWSGINEELFQTLVVMEGLKELGLDVAPVSQVQIQLGHLAIGQGDLTFYAAHWTPLHNAFLTEAGGESAIRRVGTLSSNSVQGYLIDKKTADATGIRHIEELADPEKARLFDVDGNGKADLYGCEPGWGCERVIEHHLDAYGLRDTVEHLQGGYFAIIPDAIERIRAGQPTLYYTWTPQWVSAVLRPGQEVTWLTVEKTELPGEESGTTEVEGIGNLGFTVNDQSVVANAEWLDENPQAERFLELVNIPIEDINAENLLISEGQGSEAQILQHAQDWIAANKAEWDGWIADAKAVN